MRAQLLRLLGVALGCVSLIGATDSSWAQLAFAVGEDEAISADGLHRIESSLLASGWAKPDLDLSSYKRIHFQPAVVAFREVEDHEVNHFLSRPDGLHPVPAERREQLRVLFGKKMYEAITTLDRFELTNDVGRDVLLVRGSLLDFVSGVPTDYAGARIVIRFAYEATLLMELRDSMSGEVLARTAERVRSEGPLRISDVSMLTPRFFNIWVTRVARNVDVFGDLAR